MLEMFLAIKKKKFNPGAGDTGVGPQTYANNYYDRPNGTQRAAYYGRVPPADSISAADFCSAVGLTLGTLVNGTYGWLKFYIDGKILLIAQKPFRSGVTWQNLYQLGLVYGDDTTGASPSGTAVVQNKRITIGGYVYRVRLIRGSGVDPAVASTNIDSEWNRLLYNVSTTSISTQEGGKWDTLSENDLGTGSTTSAAHCHCMETSGGTNCYLRGYNSLVGASSVGKTANNDYVRYRPVLELIGPAT